MAWTPWAGKPPVAVRSLAISLVWRAGGGYSANYHYVLEDEDGARVPDALDVGNLIPHLSPAEISQAETFMDAQVAKVEARLP